MSLLLALTGMLSFGGSPNEGIGRQQLAQLIDSAQEVNCRDVSFDYEGREAIPFKSEADRIKLKYTGSFRRRAEGASFVDIYLFGPRAGQARRGIVAVLDGTTGSSSRRADEKNATIDIKKQGPLEYAGPGNYRQIWLSDWVKKLADSAYVYEYEGVRQLDGQQCVVVRFRLVVDDLTPKDQTVSLLFWIDLKRGGQVLRHEQRHAGENLAALTTVHLGRFEHGPGRVAWLPVSGRVESRLTLKGQEQVYLDEPVRYETYDLLPATLQFDQGLKDDAFTVKAQVGDAVSDEVRKARYEFGQYMIRPKAVTKPPTDAEIKANLDRMLQDSAAMAGELKASSPLRDGPGWASNWPWAVAGLAVLGAGFLFYKSRHP